MREVICNTSPLQYLHQLEMLPLLQRLAGRIIVPPGVVQELAAGMAQGLNLPDVTRLEWVEVRLPSSLAAVPLVTDLGVGETQVLALESSDAIVILDDALARRLAASLRIAFQGTLGVLLDAKRTGLINAVAPLLDRLDVFGFRMDSDTRAAVLRRAGEAG